MAWLAQSAISTRELEFIAKLVSTKDTPDGYYLYNLEPVSSGNKNLLSVMAKRMVDQGLLERVKRTHYCPTLKAIELLKTMQLNIFDQINKYLEENQ